MEEIDELVKACLVLIPVGGIVRILYCLISINSDDGDSDGMKQKIKNIICFIVIAECLVAFVKMISGYYTN